MIYVDSSVILAQLLAEDRFPDASFWNRGPLVSSRLVEYEVWNRVHSRWLADSHGDDVRSLRQGSAGSQRGYAHLRILSGAPERLFNFSQTVAAQEVQAAACPGFWSAC